MVKSSFAGCWNTPNIEKLWVVIDGSGKAVAIKEGTGSHQDAGNRLVNKGRKICWKAVGLNGGGTNFKIAILFSPGDHRTLQSEVLLSVHPSAFKSLQFKYTVVTDVSLDDQPNTWFDPKIIIRN